MSAVGALDPTFNQTGTVTVPLIPDVGSGMSAQAIVQSGLNLVVAYEDIAVGLVVQHDGRLVAVGGATATLGSVLAVARLN